MEWDLKLPPWDLAELDRDAMPSIGSAVGPTGGLGHQASVLDCSVDLKLGGLGEFGAPDKWKDRPKLPKMAPVPFSSSKRARTQGNGSQNTSCLVDGCKADLSKCREYHQRHRVCEVHSKTPSVMVGRQEKRFCQQCSRFHLLIEFDEVKRSCRKRLDAHNKRRRKPQLDSVGSSNLFPNPQGTRFLSHPQIFSTATSEPKWAGIIKTEGGNLFACHPPLHLIDGPEQLNGFLAQTFKEGKQFPFLQDTVTAIRGRSAVETPVCRSQHKTIESSRSKIFSEGLAKVPDSDCALSLLSTSTQISGINLGQMVSASKIPMGEPLVPSLHYGSLNQFSHCQASSSVCSDGFSCSGMENEHAGTLLVSGAGDTDCHSQSMFHDGCQGLTDGNSFSLPFFWQ